MYFSEFIKFYYHLKNYFSKLQNYFYFRFNSYIIDYEV